MGDHRANVLCEDTYDPIHIGNFFVAFSNRRIARRYFLVEKIIIASVGTIFASSEQHG